MQAQEQHPWGPQDCRDKPAAGSPRRRWAVAVQMSLVWGPWSDLATRSLKPPGFSALWCSLWPPYTDSPLRTGLVGRELNAM